ncbi:MAG: hypothetical protein HQ559_14365, partial [Lentisphaerae bacterium]|nr:hypothetical protein [Lentisphaerota bacterium]
HKARRVFPTLLDIQLPFALEDCVYSFVGTARTPDKKAESLAVGARLSTVNDRLNALREAGLDPMILDHEGLALWTQSLREQPVEPAAAETFRVLMQLKGDSSTIVVGQGNRFLGAHGVRTDDAARIHRILKNHLRTDSPEVEWGWTGPGAAEEASLAPTRDLLTQEWPGRSFVHDDPETFLPRALATRAFLAGPLRANLRHGAASHPLIAKRDSRLAFRAAATALLAGLLLCGANVAWRTLAARREATLDDAFRSIAVGIAGKSVGAAKGDDALRIVRDHVERRTLALDPFLAAFRGSLMDTVDETVEAAGKHGLHIGTLLLDARTVAVTGTAQDWDACDTLKEALERKGFTMNLERKPALQSARVPFTLSSRVRND